MANETEKVTAWPYQDHFLEKGRRFIERVFGRLGIEEAFQLSLAAFCSWNSDRFPHPPLASCAPESRWIPHPENWADAFQAKTQDASASDSPTWNFFAAMPGVVFEWVVDDELKTQSDKASNFVLTSRAVRLGVYDCVLVLEHNATLIDSHPQANPNSDSNTGTPVSLLRAVSQAVLSALRDEALQTSSLFSSHLVDDSQIDGVLRDAGKRLLEAAATEAWGLGLQYDDLFQQLNVVSSLRYESKEAVANIELSRKGQAREWVMCFEEAVPLNDPVWARKTMELSSDDFFLACEGGKLNGVVAHTPETKGDFVVRMLGQNKWQLLYDQVVLAEVILGLPRFARKQVNRADFLATWTRLFPNASAESSQSIWTVLEQVIKNRQSGLLVVAEDAAAEVERLSSHGMKITPVRLSGNATILASQIDGAVFLDTNGICHGVGVILDGQANVRGDPSRGARFNSALRYVAVENQPGRLAIVLSEDDHVNLLPRLRPPILLSQIKDALAKALDQPDGPPSVEAKRVFNSTLRHYFDYLMSFLSEKDRDKLILIALPQFRETKAVIPIYDPHGSDIVNDLPEKEDEDSGTE